MWFLFHPFLSKKFEKLMYRRLYSFLEVHNILYSLQFGFQEHHSIDHALVRLTESVKNKLDNKRLGCGIFIDLQRAFDTPNHKILFSKLEHYGICGCGLEWLDHICRIGSNMFLLMENPLAYLQLLVEYLKGLYWAQYYFLFKTSLSCFHDCFLFNSSAYQYSTRHASHGNPYMPQKNCLQCGMKSTCYLGAMLWNTLPI